MLKVTEIIQTCSACPTQFEGRTSDNRRVYVRYRWGYLSVRIGEIGGDIYTAVNGTEVFGKVIDPEGWDGTMFFDELKEITKGFVQWPDYETE